MSLNMEIATAPDLVGALTGRSSLAKARERRNSVISPYVTAMAELRFLMEVGAALVIRGRNIVHAGGIMKMNVGIFAAVMGAAAFEAAHADDYDAAKQALADEVVQAADAMRLACEAQDSGIVFDFVISESAKGVVWTTRESPGTPSPFVDHKDRFGYKATVKFNGGKISWAVKTAYGREYGTIDRVKLTFDMHAIFSGEDIANAGRCRKS